MTTRIGIIREAIEAEGGNRPEKSGFDYYADGPSSSATSKRRNESVYKVPRYHDGLTLERRKRVVDALRQHPDVKDAYLSRPCKSVYAASVVGGHLKVVFQN